MPEVAEPPVTTSSLPSAPSFLDDPAVQKEWEQALAADGNLSPTVPKIEVPPVKEPESAKPADKPAEKPAEAKPAEKAAEKPKADDDEIPSDVKSPAAQSSWKKLKESKKAIETERDSIRSERDKLKSEYEALKAQATTPAQKANLADDHDFQALKKTLEAKEKEANELSERMRLIDVEQHPKFQAYFKAKTDQQFAIAKEIGGDKLVELLQLPPSEYRKDQILSLMAEMNEVDKSTLGAVMTNLRSIDAERQSEIAKARDSYQQIQAEQKLNTERQVKEMRDLFARTTAEVTDKTKGLSVFQEREGDDEWNKGVRERLALAQSAFEAKLKPEDGMKMIYWGAAAPAILQQNKGLMQKVSELEATITELRAAAPSPGGETKGDPDAAPRSTKSGLDAIMEEIETILPGAR